MTTVSTKGYVSNVSLLRIEIQTSMDNYLYSLLSNVMFCVIDSLSKCAWERKVFDQIVVLITNSRINYKFNLNLHKSLLMLVLDFTRITELENRSAHDV